MATDSAPKLRRLTVRAVRVPMREPHQTASGAVAESPLVLTDALFDDGLVGHSVVFTYTPLALQPVAELIRNIGTLVEGEPLAPAEIEQKLARRFRLLGTQGLVGIALAAIDMALWDALARSHRTSLVSSWAAARRPFPAYGAVGYDGALRSAQVAEDWAKRGASPASRPRSATRRCRRTSPSSARCGARSGDEVVDHGRLQPVPDAGRGRAADARARCRGTRPGSRSRRSRTTTPDTRSSPARPRRRSSAARTGGARSTCSMRSMRRHRIT